LTRAFMYAGAPLVGVTLWSVDDKPTADLMVDFYKNLLAGNGGKPAAALRAARQNMIADRKYSAPFYWAPFVLIGDWR
jgi:CHAT domain-containing protein